MSTLTGILVLLGALIALAGSTGLLTLNSFYERVHPPTMGATLGTGLILIACVVHFSKLEGHIVVHHLLIGVFMLITTPVTYMMLVRAALHRDAAEGKDHLASRSGMAASTDAPAVAPAVAPGVAPADAPAVAPAGARETRDEPGNEAPGAADTSLR